MSNTNHFQDLYREANERGMRDFDRGVELADNPFKEDKATEQAARWREGWLNAYELKRGEAL